MVCFNWLVATKASEVGVSWFDFNSIGHVCFGIGAFLCISLFYTIPKAKGQTPIFSLLFVFILTIIPLVVWEIVENTILITIGIKFENRIDSPQNIFTDIMCGLIGALGTWLFAHITFEKNKKIWPYYTFGIISLGLWFGIFVILRFLTL
ncbi:MAG: hypothetical protein ACFFAO_10285 [Candidatus Hermodarchaeota archaeon]